MNIIKDTQLNKELKEKFPDAYEGLFDSEGNLNPFGKIAKEALEARKRKREISDFFNERKKYRKEFEDFKRKQKA